MDNQPLSTVRGAKASKNIIDPMTRNALAKLIGALSILLTTFGFEIQAEERVYRFDILPQQLEQAITEFAKVTNYQFIYSRPDIRQMDSPGVVGTFSADSALKSLLQNTPARHRYINEDTLLLYVDDNQTDDSIIPAIADGAANQHPEHDDPGGFTIEEILVTARKRTENLQDTPISISAFFREALRLRQVSSSDKLAQITPNLTFDSNAPTSGHSQAAQIFIRGIGQQEFLGVSDPGVGLYVDGVYYAATTSSVVDFLDVEHIEILRGPQGTLFGRNTIGGAISAHTQKPEDEVSGYLSMKIGSDDLLQTRLNLNSPITDNLLGRITLGTKDRDGYVKRILADTDVGDDNISAARLGLLWSPIENAHIFFGADYKERDENGAPLVFGGVNAGAAFPSAPAFTHLETGCTNPLDTNDPRCWNNQWAAGAFANNGTFPTESSISQWGVNLTVDWNVSERFSIKSITAHREVSTAAFRDADNTPLTGFHTVIDDQQNQFSQEFQFIGTALDERLDWLLGLYYFQEKIDSKQPLTFGLDQGVKLDFKADNQASALFGQTSYKLTERWDITFGARVTSERKSFLPDQRAFGPGGFSGLPSGTFFVPFKRERVEFDDTTIMSSISYKWTKDLMSYFSYTEGFKSGGFNARYITLGEIDDVTSFNPETAETVEVGFKSELLGKRLRLNAAAFRTRYNDLLVTVRSGVAPALFNGGRATIQGLELEWTFVPNNNWLITGGFGYIDAEYDKIDPGLSSFGVIEVKENNSLALTPEFSINGGIAYTFNFSGWVVTPTLNWSLTDDKFFDAENRAFAHQDEVNIFNTAVSFNSADEHWEIELGITNLTDKRYKVAATDASTTGLAYIEQVFARKREWSVKAMYKW